MHEYGPLVRQQKPSVKYMCVVSSARLTDARDHPPLRRINGSGHDSKVHATDHPQD